MTTDRRFGAAHRYWYATAVMRILQLLNRLMMFDKRVTQISIAITGVVRIVGFSAFAGLDWFHMNEFDFLDINPIVEQWFDRLIDSDKRLIQQRTTNEDDANEHRSSENNLWTLIFFSLILSRFVKVSAVLNDTVGAFQRLLTPSLSTRSLVVELSQQLVAD